MAGPDPRASHAITVFLGTKAQYIKTAPVLSELDRRGVGYRVIDSGQHAAIMAELRRELAVRDPEFSFGGSRDVTTVPGALGWSAGVASWLVRRRRLREEVFGPRARLCLVHGDTPSTLLACLLARRAGLEVVHLEAGLRSHHLLHPFPEELIRLVVMRASGVLFAPDEVAMANLVDLRLRGRALLVPGNTSIDALRTSLGEPPAPASGPAVVTMHRVENLHARGAVEGFVALVERLGAKGPVRFVVHGPTRAVLERGGHLARLVAAGVETVPLLGHRDFVRLLAAAPLVVTDGGSIQEECALLGVPTLLWRRRTERPDGLGANVVLGRDRPEVVERFVRDPSPWRRGPAWADRASPAAWIADQVVARAASAEQAALSGG